jgi:hypothetical protein
MALGFDLEHGPAIFFIEEGSDWQPTTKRVMKLLLACSHLQTIGRVSNSATAGKLQIVCAWCKIDMGTKPCIAAMDGQRSHGMCSKCRAVHLYKLSKPGDEDIAITAKI